MANKQKLTLLKSSDKEFEIFIPREVEAKIRHLCTRVHDVEWSGTLFYKAEGSMEDETFKVTCLDIFVMDIGTATTTDYDESADVVGYMVDHPELLQDGVCQGLIHSHNNMSTFFSGTDTGTLLSEGQDTVHFVSLIVNNAGTYTAGVTRRIDKCVKAHYTISTEYKTYGESTIVINPNEVKEEEFVKSAIEWFNLKVTKEEAPNNFADIDARLSEIRSAKAARQRQTPSYGIGMGIGVGTSMGMGRVTSPNVYVNGKPQTPIGDYGNHKVETLNDREASSQTIAVHPKNKMDKQKKEQPSQVSTKQVNKVIEQELPFPPSDTDMENNELPFCLLEKYDEEIIKQVAYQVLTGSIMIDDDIKDMDKWLSNFVDNDIDMLYLNRFGNYIDENSDDYDPEAEDNIRFWFETYLMWLVDTPDSKFDSMLETNMVTRKELQELCAYDTIRYLKKLPNTSIIVDWIIEELETYLPDGIEDYITDTETK